MSKFKKKKAKPRQNNMSWKRKKKISSKTIKFLLCWLLLSMGPALKCGLSPVRLPWRKEFFLWECLLIGDSFLAGDGSSCPQPILVLGPCLFGPVQTLCMLSQSLWWLWMTLFPWFHSLPQTLNSLPAASSSSFPEPSEGNQILG